MAKCNGSCDHISEYLIDPIKNNSFDPLLRTVDNKKNIKNQTHLDERNSTGSTE